MEAFQRRTRGEEFLEDERKQGIVRIQESLSVLFLPFFGWCFLGKLEPRNRSDKEE